MIIGGTNLSMVAGDSESLGVKFNKNTVHVPFEDGDTVYFSVKKRIKDTEYVLQKIVREFTEEGIAIVYFLPSDTNHILPTTYIYDIQITFKDGTVITIVEASDFVIRPGVTHD